MARSPSTEPFNSGWILGGFCQYTQQRETRWLLEGSPQRDLESEENVPGSVGQVMGMRARRGEEGDLNPSVEELVPSDEVRTTGPSAFQKQNSFQSFSD